MESRIPFPGPAVTGAEARTAGESLQRGDAVVENVTRLEEVLARYCGADASVCLSSCAAALELTLRMLGIGERDEVALPALSHPAAAAAVRNVGARPVFADSREGYFELENLNSAITPRTRAVILAEPDGIPCDYDAAFAVLAERRREFSPKNALAARMGRIALISDSARSLGAEYRGRRVGSIADFTCFSFGGEDRNGNPVACGGAVTLSPDNGIDIPAAARQLRLLSGQGYAEEAGRYGDVLLLGHARKMDGLNAAVGLARLARSDSALARRRELAARYCAALSGNIAPVLPADGDLRPAYSGFPIRLLGKTASFRDEAILRLAALGISTGIRYRPLPLLTAYRSLGYDVQCCPNALAYSENLLSLPLFAGLSDEDADWMLGQVREICG